MTEFLSKIGWEIGKKIGTDFAKYLKNEYDRGKLIDQILENLGKYLSQNGKSADAERIINNIRTALKEFPLSLEAAAENFHQPEVLATEFMEKVLLDEQLNEPDLVRGAIETLFQELTTRRDIFDQIYPKVLQSMSKVILENKNNHEVLGQLDDNVTWIKEFMLNRNIQDKKPGSKWHSDITRAETGLFGREDELEKIGANLANRGSVLLVGGAGGIGKTALAAEWFYSRAKNYRHCIALKVTEGLSAALLNSSTLRQELGLPDSPEGIVEQFAAALNKLDGQNLLLLDDIRNDFLEELENIYQLKPNWTKLFTSREKVGHIPAMTLDVLNPEDATELFKQIFYGDRNFAESEEQQADTRKLLEIVGFHALGVKLFARAGSEAGLSVANMLEAGLSSEARLNFEYDPEQSATDLMNYYRETFKPQDWPENLREVLKQFSFLPDGFLPDADIRELFPEQMGDLAELTRKGLVEKVAGKWRMHAVIRAFVRKEFAPGFDECRGFLEHMFSLFKYDKQNPEHIIRDKVRWIEYARSASEVLLNHSEALGFIDRTAFLFQNSGFYNEAKIYNEACLGIALRQGDESRVSTQRNNLANVLLQLGDYAGAKEQLGLSMESNMKTFGPDHPNVAIRRSNLAIVLRNLGDYAGAREQLELALESDLKNLGPDHPEVAIKRSNLANVLGDLGDSARAKEQLELALESDLRTFGPDHSEVATCRSNLAIVLSYLGDYAGAREQLELALESDLKNLGPDHPEVAIKRSNLANVLGDLGDSAGAKEQLELSLESGLKTFGPDHHNVAIRYNNLGHVHKSAGEISEAETCFRKALEICQKTLPPEHPHILQVEESLRIVQSKKQ